MDETTLKTVDNAVVICAESAKNATESATKALEAKQDVDARVAELGETIQAAEEDIKRTEGFAQSASKSAESANQSAIFVNTAKDEVTRIGAQITTDKALIAGYASSASSGASRAEEAKRIAVNASESVSGMQDEINATKRAIDATAKTVQSNADAVANAKTEIDGKLATANTAINEAVGKAEQAKDDAVTAQSEASKSAENASTSASNASKSATASATSATQAQEFATQAQGAVVNTLKRQEYAGGAIYSTIFTQLASVVTLDKAKIKALTDAKAPTAQTGLLAYKDRYLMITTSGWICLNGDTLEVISAGKWGETKATIYALSEHWCVAFNGQRIAVFYRIDENTTSNRHAEVFDANTGAQLVDKTFTDAEMELIASAPNKVTMSCFTKDGDIVYWGSVFDQELTHKGYVNAVDGLPKFGQGITYCCYADNVNYDAPIMYAVDGGNSIWLDDRYTLDEDGKPILTLRRFDPDGKGQNNYHIQFSQYSKGYGWTRHNVAAVAQHGANVSIYDVTIDPTEKAFVFSNKTALTNVKIEQVAPANFFTTDLVYTSVSFYVKKGVEVYAVKEKTMGDAPVAILEGENGTNYTAGDPKIPSVSFTSKRLRPIPLRYPFYDGEALLWTRQIK